MSPRFTGLKLFTGMKAAGARLWRCRLYIAMPKPAGLPSAPPRACATRCSPLLGSARSAHHTWQQRLRPCQMLSSGTHADLGRRALTASARAGREPPMTVTELPHYADLPLDRSTHFRCAYPCAYPDICQTGARSTYQSCNRST